MNAEISGPIFDVDIAAPIIEEKTVPRVERVPVKPHPPIHRKPPLKDVLSEPPPKTMFGEGTGSELSPATIPEEGSGRDTAGMTQGDEASSKSKEGVLPEGQKGLSLKPKSFLFDKETIEKYAQKKTAKEREKGLTFDAPELLHRGYMRMLKDKIESIWRYPEEAVRRGVSGDLYITFYIQRDGKLGEVKLVRTSGFRELDEAAMRALRDAEPFWPLPEDWKEDTLEIKGHFIYILGDTYVM
jgi:protein TonB